MPFLMRERLRIGVLAWLLMSLFSAAPGAAATGGPTVKTDQGCYVVGSSVALYGAGFAAGRTYHVTVDGVDFGQSRTDPGGGFATHFAPGGLGAGVVQSVHRVGVTDGTSSAEARFTVTRPTGARFEVPRGDPRTLRARFEAWGFAEDGVARALYVHYVSPSGRARTTVRVGQTGGQCGFLETQPRRMFPFAPSVGLWTLQVDSLRSYSAQPTGAWSRVRVVIRRG